MGVENRNELITVSIGGKTFKTCRQCAAHLKWTIDKLKKRYPNARLRIIQPSFNTRVKASEGTHDHCSCFDVEIIGLKWSTAQRFLRSCGWAAWWRTPAQGFINHIHMASITCTQRKGIYVDGGLSQFGEKRTSSQLDDYYLHTFGLKNMHNVDLDKSWFPGDEGAPPWPVGTPAQWRADINKTLFDYDEWLDSQMDDKQMERLANMVRDKVLNARIDKDKPVTVRGALRSASNTPGLVRELKKLVVGKGGINDSLNAIKNRTNGIKEIVDNIKTKLGA